MTFWREDSNQAIVEMLCDNCGVAKFPTDEDRYADPERWCWAPWRRGQACDNCGAIGAETEVYHVAPVDNGRGSPVWCLLYEGTQYCSLGLLGEITEDAAISRARTVLAGWIKPRTVVRIDASPAHITTLHCTV